MPRDHLGEPLHEVVRHRMPRAADHTVGHDQPVLLTGQLRLDLGTGEQIDPRAERLGPPASALSRTGFERTGLGRRPIPS
jgi:hypothetical protein